ncbi:MAG: PDZ domain-containing protein, partial [Verrucomicrobiia bacterium]
MTLVDLFHILWTLAVALILFSITVFVHELGHFLAARRKGLHVERFAIGMGPRVFGFKWRGVDYVFNWLPIGGYVALPQMAPMEAVEGKSDPALKSLPPVTPWAKIVTAFWGPLFSFLLACLLSVAVWYFGKPERPTFQTTTIGYVRPDSPAAQAGLRPGDTILTIDGVPVTRWMGGNQGILEAIIFSRGSTILLTVQRAGEGELTFDIPPIRAQELEGLRQIGIAPMEPLVVDRVLPHSPAAAAGILPGDVIFGINDQTVFSTEQVRDLLAAADGPVRLTIRRADDLVQLNLRPVIPDGTNRPMIGVQWRPPDSILTHPLPWIQIKDAA